MREPLLCFLLFSFLLLWVLITIIKFVVQYSFDSFSIVSRKKILMANSCFIGVFSWLHSCDSTCVLRAEEHRTKYYRKPSKETHEQIIFS